MGCGCGGSAAVTSSVVSGITYWATVSEALSSRMVFESATKERYMLDPAERRMFCLPEIDFEQNPTLFIKGEACSR